MHHQFMKEQEVEQAHDYVAAEREHRVTGVLENRTMLQQQTQEEGEVYGEDDLLDHGRKTRPMLIFSTQTRPLFS